MFEDIAMRVKLAFVLFLFGKMTSVFVVCSIFSGDRESYFVLMFLYVSLVLSALLLALSDMKRVKGERV